MLHSACAGGNANIVRDVHQYISLLVVDSNGDTPLHAASTLGHSECVKALLSIRAPILARNNSCKTPVDVSKQKAAINSHNGQGNTPLQVAVLCGEEEVVSTLVNDFDCDPNVKDNHGRSLLHSACIGGHVSMVQTLVYKYSQDINAVDDQSNMPLHLAALHGNREVALMLLDEFKCDPSARGHLGRTLLHTACSAGHVNLVKTLINEYKADISDRDSEMNTALHVAAICGRDELVLELIDDFQCSLKDKGHLGRTLLHSACIGGNVSLVQTLILKYNVVVNARDEQNDTPLHLAGEAKLVLMLINEFQCDPNVRGYLGRTLLHSACSGGNVSLVKTLIVEHKADINAQDDQNHTPLQVAVLYGKQDVALALIDQFVTGTSLLHTACSVGNEGIVQDLLLSIGNWAPDNGGNGGPVQTLLDKHRGDIYAQDDENNTSIHVAALCGKMEVVLALINDFHCDPNGKGHHGRSLLHSACGGGNVSLVEALINLKHQTNLNALDIQGNTPLHVAALSGREEMVLALINKFQCDPAVRGYQGRSLLHSACVGGNVNIVRDVHQYISLLVVDSNGDTPLHAASTLGHSECVKALLSIQAPILARNNSSKTPVGVSEQKAAINSHNGQGLEVAVLWGEKEMVSTLVNDFDCDPNVKGNLGRSLLHSACIGGHVSMVQTLIYKYNQDINAVDDQSNVPLHLAVLHGNREVVLMLLDEFKCDPSARGHLGRTLLHSACIEGNISLVRTLIVKYNADVNARDEQNDTPLHVAASCGEDKLVLMLINEFNCDPNVRGYLGRTLLHSACSGGNVSLVKTLIVEHKADINSQDDQNHTPLQVAVLCGKQDVALALIDQFVTGTSLLHTACSVGNKGIVRDLLLSIGNWTPDNGGNGGPVQTLLDKHRGDIYALDDENNTPIHVAALCGKMEVVLTLINDFRCDPNGKGHYGRSLLHSACGGGNVSLVEALINLKHQTDLDALDIQGNTPLHVAALCGREEMVLALINKFECDPAVRGYQVGLCFIQHVLEVMPI